MNTVGYKSCVSLYLFLAMMSEDSDYTSDIYPVQHQHNSSAHQYPREHPYRHQREDSYDSRDYQPSQDYYGGDSFERDASFDRDYDDRGYERERDYYMYQENSYQQGRSDTDSEPLFYNSRPNSRPRSFITDRYVVTGALTFPPCSVHAFVSYSLRRRHRFWHIVNGRYSLL